MKIYKFNYLQFECGTDSCNCTFDSIVSDLDMRNRYEFHCNRNSSINRWLIVLLNDLCFVQTRRIVIAQLPHTPQTTRGPKANAPTKICLAMPLVSAIESLAIKQRNEGQTLYEAKQQQPILFIGWFSSFNANRLTDWKHQTLTMCWILLLIRSDVIRTSVKNWKIMIDICACSYSVHNTHVNMAKSDVIPTVRMNVIAKGKPQQQPMKER